MTNVMERVEKEIRPRQKSEVANEGKLAENNVEIVTAKHSQQRTWR